MKNVKLIKSISTILLFSSFTVLSADIVSDKLVNGNTKIWIDLNNNGVENNGEVKTNWVSSKIEDNKGLVKSVYLVNNIGFTANDLNYLNDNYQNIEQLTINNNVLNDKIVDISNLSKLKFLTINNSKLKNINLKNNSNIIKINLNDNLLKSFDFSGDVNLSELYLKNNYLSEISTISDSSKLQLLDLSGSNNNIVSITSISNMPDLSILNLDVTDIQKTDTSDGRALAGSNFCLNSSIATDYKDNKEYKEYLQICDDENSFLYALADDYTTYSVWVDLDEDDIIDDGEEEKSWDVNTLVDNTDKIKSIKNIEFLTTKIVVDTKKQNYYNYYYYSRNGTPSLNESNLNIKNELSNLNYLGVEEFETNFFKSKNFNNLLNKTPNLENLLLVNFELDNYQNYDFFDFKNISNIGNLHKLKNILFGFKVDRKNIRLDYLKDLNLKTFIDISIYYNVKKPDNFMVNFLPKSLEIIHFENNYGEDFTKFKNLKSFSTVNNIINKHNRFNEGLYDFTILKQYGENYIENINKTNIGKNFIFTPNNKMIKGSFYIAK